MQRFIQSLCFILAFLPSTVMADQPDVRVIIDVSGSMKQNDPHNLRGPALRLLSGLMPPESDSGVWTFARQVNMLVPWQTVNNDWRQLAQQQSAKIHSKGLFTDIEQALQRTIADIEQSQPNKQRSLILLSDGLVDLQAGSKASEASRQRILDELLPRVKKLGIKVHSIALSSNADHALLEQLSMETNGWYRQVDTADELERIFLHLFEQATQRDQLPLKDNHFSTDTAVQEMTVLVFREAGSEAAILRQPDQQYLQHGEQTPGVRWQHEAHYDLVTIEKPIAGDWYIDGALDPDNRVMVVTDLQLDSSDLPNNVLVGERFDVTATLKEQDVPIERDDFLQLVEASLLQENEQGEISEVQLERSGQSAQFRMELGTLFEPGRNDIVITAVAPTFERQRRQSVNVVDVPLDIQLQQLDTSLRSHRLILTADKTLVDPASLQINALLSAEDGSEFSYQVLRQDENHWQLTVADLKPQLEYQLALQIRGQTPNGRRIFLQPKTLTVRDKKPVVEIDSDAAEIKMNLEASLPAAQDSVELAGNTPAEPLLTDNDILLLGNIFIALFLFAGFWIWHRTRKRHLASEDLL